MAEQELHEEQPVEPGKPLRPDPGSPETLGGSMEPKSGSPEEIPSSKPSQSLGRWIDNLLGDKKIREKAAAKARQRERFLRSTKI